MQQGDFFFNKESPAAPSHPWIILKRSCAAYQYAKVTSVKQLDFAFSKGLLLSLSHVSEATLKKLLDGARDSDELKNAHRGLLRRQSLIP